MSFTFIDLFAGIGGTRLAFERAGGKCVFSSEIDVFARITYSENFGDTPSGDLMRVEEDLIPSHDVLVAGFPCQPFSLAGVSKRNSLNMPHGFGCKKDGRLFFKISKILKIKQPRAFFLENVKHLRFHKNGETYSIIQKNLENAGYKVFSKLIDSRKVVPQHRERIYIVGFRKDLAIKFHFPTIPDLAPKLGDILEASVDPKYTLSDRLWNYLQVYAKKQREKRNGFGYGLASPEGITRTLSARYYKDGAEILISQKEKNPRRLTPRECARLMGFPSTFVMPVSDTQAYKQFGNSVVIPIVERIAKKIADSLCTRSDIATTQVMCT
jgi:DNA (cytosine-5)-methyltransferase 1